jgi:SAM-dependent methyltransferase
MSQSQLMPPVDIATDNSEIERIRVEYARRKREIPETFYGWDRVANCFTHTQLIRDCIAGLTEAGRFPLDGGSVADIGCGSGTWLLEFAQWGATNLYGIDLDESRIGRAKAGFPSANVSGGDARSLPWKDRSFDLVSQFTLFSSILNSVVKTQIAQEMWRVLKPGGVILWFDLRVNNPRNANVRGVHAGEIRSLFPDASIWLRPVVLAPPIARRIVPISWIAASLLEKIPALRTHYLGIFRKS